MSLNFFVILHKYRARRLVEKIDGTPALLGAQRKVDAITIIANGAANRDPRMFERPDAFEVDRSNAKLHIAFGSGRHTCPGAPFARAETVVALNRFFDLTSDIRICEEAHGPREARRYGYLPTFILRGLTHLVLEFDPVSES